MTPVLSINRYITNGHLIAAVAKLDHLRQDDLVLDASYGRGTFWTEFRPDRLITNDLRTPAAYNLDVRDLREKWDDQSFDATVWDGPYKLNGTPDEEVDERYGVHEPTTPQERMELLVEGAVICAHLSKRTLLVKCQDQVVSGRKVWQTDAITEAVLPVGYRKVDRLDYLGRREQPGGRKQRNSHSCSSQLLIFRRTRRPA